ncbi:MAG: hypothetical protein ABI592_02060 [Acidobacteriota bacterium]
MKNRSFRALSLLLSLSLAASAFADPAAPKSAPKSAAAAAGPRLEVGVESLLDRRSTGTFPSPSLTVSLTLQGADAASVISVRPKVTKAADDTGKNLILPEGTGMQRGADGWQSSLGGHGAPTPQLDLANPARQAKTVTAIEGVLEAYMPARDPGATVKIDRILGRKDKPAAAIPGLASQRIQLRVLSKAGLEKEKKAAEAKKAAAEKKKGKKEGLEGMADALTESLVSALGMLFMTAGENDLILRVDDPGKKVFSLDLASPDGKPISSYGSTDMEGYRIMRLLEPLPANATLQVRLKTAKSFAQVPFALANVKLP